MEQQKVAEMNEQAVSPEVPAVCPAVKKAGRPAKYASAAERQAAYRARKGNVKGLAVDLPADLMAELGEYMKRQHMNVDPDLTLAQVVEKLLRQQLLRKR